MEPGSRVYIPFDNQVLRAHIDRASYFTTLNAAPEGQSEQAARAWERSRLAMSALELNGCRILYWRPDGQFAKLLLTVTHTMAASVVHDVLALPATMPTSLSMPMCAAIAGASCTAGGGGGRSCPLWYSRRRVVVAQREVYGTR